MLDAVTASTAIDRADLSVAEEQLATAGFRYESQMWANGTLCRDQFVHNSSAASRPTKVTLDRLHRRLIVKTNLPRHLRGTNWSALTASEVFPACAKVDTHLRTLLGPLYTQAQVPPFMAWDVQRAEFPYDIRLTSAQEVEWLLRDLANRPMLRLRKDGGLPRSFPNAAGGPGLLWQGTGRETALYGKYAECRDPECPRELLRLETRVWTSKQWQRIQQAVQLPGRITVGDAGSVAVASHVLEETYDRLALHRPVVIGTHDPYPELVPDHGPKKARTLAAFYECCCQHGEFVTRERYPSMFRRYQLDLIKAGITPRFGGPEQQDALVHLALIPRPTPEVLTARWAA